MSSPVSPRALEIGAHRREQRVADAAVLALSDRSAIGPIQPAGSRSGTRSRSRSSPRPVAGEAAVASHRAPRRPSSTQAGYRDLGVAGEPRPRSRVLDRSPSGRRRAGAAGSRNASRSPCCSGRRRSVAARALGLEQRQTSRRGRSKSTPAPDAGAGRPRVEDLQLSRSVAETPPAEARAAAPPCDAGSRRRGRSTVRVGSTASSSSDCATRGRRIATEARRRDRRRSSRRRTPSRVGTVSAAGLECCGHAVRRSSRERRLASFMPWRRAVTRPGVSARALEVAELAEADEGARRRGRSGRAATGRCRGARGPRPGPASRRATAAARRCRPRGGGRPRSRPGRRSNSVRSMRRRAPTRAARSGRGRRRPPRAASRRKGKPTSARRCAPAMRSGRPKSTASSR